MIVDDNYLKVIQEFISLTNKDSWNKETKDALKKFSVFWNQKTIDSLNDFLSLNYEKMDLFFAEQTKLLIQSIVYNHLCGQASNLPEEEYYHNIELLIQKYQKLSFINVCTLAKEALEEAHKNTKINKRERFFLQKSPRRP